MAYCAVTGRESRLPLKIRGQGVGPQIQLSFDTLDIQNVFVNSSHAYEVDLLHYSTYTDCAHMLYYMYLLYIHIVQVYTYIYNM